MNLKRLTNEYFAYFIKRGEEYFPRFIFFNIDIFAD